MKNKNYQDCKNFCQDQGVDLFGVADVSDIKSEFNLSSELTQDLNKAICVGVRLSEQIFKDIIDAPTKLYFHHYKTANFFLDQLTFKISGWIERQGAAALPIAASQIIDWKKQNAYLSHKRLGVLAGLGWIGRNNLLVSPELGSRFRIASVLTNFDIDVDRPLKVDCGDCYDCVKVCPVSAIGKSAKDFQHLACFEKLKEFQKANIVGQYICGICVNVCKPKTGEGK